MMADLNDDDLDEIALGESIDMIRTPDRISMLAFDMAQEIRRRRAADLTDSDRSALRIAIRELTERRNNYQARLAHLTERTDPHVREVYERAVAEVEEAIEVCGRLGGK